MNNYCDAHAGALYSVDGAGNFVKHIDQVTISNGLVWSADGTKFWFIDTAKGQVDEYGFDGASGTLTGGPRTAISLDAAVRLSLIARSCSTDRPILAADRLTGIRTAAPLMPKTKSG